MIRYLVSFRYAGKEYSGVIDSSLSLTDCSDERGAKDLATEVIKDVLKNPRVKKEGAIPTNIVVTRFDNAVTIGSFVSLIED